MLTTLKAFDCVDQDKLENSQKRWECQTTLSASWETCMQVKNQELELDMKQQIGKVKKGIQRNTSKLHIVTLLI